MLKITLLRLVSFAVVISLGSLVSRKHFVIALAILGLTHYLMSAVYSFPVFKRNFVNKKNYLGLVLLAGLCVITMLYKWPTIYVFFGVHHLLTEIYGPKLVYGSASVVNRSALLYGRTLFHAMSYFLTLATSYLERIDGFYKFSSVIAFLVVFVVYLFALGAELKKEKKNLAARDLFFAEGIFGAVVFLSFFQVMKFGFNEILFYHFFYWSLVPLPKLFQMAWSQVAKYLALTVAVGLVCFAAIYGLSLNRSSLFGSPLMNTAYFYLTLFGYFHISSSFALSSLNPNWIQRVFKSDIGNGA